MHTFEQFTPTSLPEALQLITQRNGDTKVIAGGTDLMLQMRNGTQTPRTLINIKRLPELKGIRYTEGAGLEIGALTTLREIHRSPIIAEHYPALSYAASRMASEQIRTFATVGGNLCNGSPSADQSTPLLALDGSVKLVSPQGTRALPLQKFFLGPGITALQPGELLQSISVPPPTGKMIFLKHIPRAHMDISVVCVAIRLTMEGKQCQESRVVLGAVAPTPLRAGGAEAALIGIITPDRIAQAASIAREESRPIDDAKGSAWYRKHMVGILVKRGISTLLEST